MQLVYFLFRFSSRVSLRSYHICRYTDVSAALTQQCSFLDSSNVVYAFNVILRRRGQLRSRKVELRHEMHLMN